MVKSERPTICHGSLEVLTNRASWPTLPPPPYTTVALRSISLLFSIKWLLYARQNTICRAQQTNSDIFFIRSGLLLYTLKDQCSFDRYKLCIYTCHFDNNTQIDREQSCPVPEAQRMKLLVSNSTLAETGCTQWKPCC